MDKFGRTSATIETGERSVADIVNDIGRNLQDIIRSEVKLAKVELGETSGRVRSSSSSFAAGGILGVYAVGFLALTAMFALEIVLPAWLAALIIGVLLAIGASIGISMGRRIFKTVQPPNKTLETLKEDFQWMKEQGKS